MTTPAATNAAQPLTPASATPRGRFLWHELLARDHAAAVAFYPPVTGWAVTEMPGGHGPYTMFAQGEMPQCGIQPYPAADVERGMPALSLPYVGTEDVDATCREAVSLGATQLLAPMDIPSVGRIAVLRDPQGAQFALYTPSAEPHPEAKPGVGEFAWHEMICDDPEASFAFYRQLFGWDAQHAMDMGADGIYQMYGRGAFTYGGFMRRSPAMPPSAWNCYVRVADLDASIAAVKAHGGKIVMGPHPVPNDDRVCIAVDNQGAVISLVGAVLK